MKFLYINSIYVTNLNFKNSVFTISKNYENGLYSKTYKIKQRKILSHANLP
jgi:hypothetical protein